MFTVPHGTDGGWRGGKAQGEGADGPMMHDYGAVDQSRRPGLSGAYVAPRSAEVDHRPPECEPSPSETSDRRLEYLDRTTRRSLRRMCLNE